MTLNLLLKGVIAGGSSLALHTMCGDIHIAGISSASLRAC